MEKKYIAIYDAETKQEKIIEYTDNDYKEDSKTYITEQHIRELRNNLLSNSDWTQLPDAPVDRQKWNIYRQQLRDITTQSGFPYDVIWPNAPI